MAPRRRAGPVALVAAPPPMPVETLTLAEKPVEILSEYVGSLKCRRTTTVQPQVEGFITRIAVRSGEQVQRGAVLFEVDSATQQAGFASLRARARFVRQSCSTRYSSSSATRRSTPRARSASARSTVRDGAADGRGAAEGARRADATAAQPAVVLPRHLADRRHRRRHSGQRRRSRHPDHRAHHRGRERRARALHQRARAAGGRLEGRAAGAPRRRSRPGARHQQDHVRLAERRHPTQSVLAKAQLVEGRGQFRSDQFVRARSRLERRARPDRAGDRGDAHQRAVLRVRRREAGRQDWWRNRSPCSSAISSATTTWCTAASRPASS